MDRSLSFKDLLVWQRSMEIVRRIYDLSSNFPNSEKYGLTDQIRRAAISIPSNIAEGHARTSHRDFVRFLRIANGSAAEVITQLHIAASLGYIAPNEATGFETEIVIIQKMISKLIISIGLRSSNQQPIN